MRARHPNDVGDAISPELKAAKAAAIALLAERASDATVCPSEVARTVAAKRADPSGWRALMPIVHAAVDALFHANLLKLSWKGRSMAVREGPYRIGRPTTHGSDGSAPSGPAGVIDEAASMRRSDAESVDVNLGSDSDER